MRLKDFKRPYNDDFMEYNYLEHRYKLTVDGANQSKMDMVKIWGGENYLNDYLELLSRTLYAVLLKNKDSKYYEKQLWILAHSKKYRQAIFQMFLDVIWYNFQSGGFLTLYQSGINLNEMKQIEVEVDKAFSVITNQMADNFGINERYPRYNVSKYNSFDTFEELKDFLISNNYFNVSDLEDIDNIYDLPSYQNVYIGKHMIKNHFYVEDFNYWYDELELKGDKW